MGGIRGLFIFALAVLCVPAALAQRSGGGQTPPGSGSAPPSNNPNPGGNFPTNNTPYPTTNVPRQPGQGQMELQHPWFLSGKVVMEDGTAPPESVVIERTCGPLRRPEGYTDAKGNFSFQVGESQQAMTDASIGSTDLDPFGTQAGRAGMPGTNVVNPMAGGSANQLIGCELKAVLPGYRSDIVNLTGRRRLDSPDVGRIVLHRIGEVQGDTISVTSLEAPKDAKKSYEKGLDAVKKQKWAEVQKQMQKAVDAYPKYASAWFELGMAQLRQNMVDAAQASFLKAVEADPKYVKPFLPMASIAIARKNWGQAAALSSRLVRMDPVDFPQAFLYNAIANASLQKFEAAEKSAREVLKLDSRHQYPYAEYVLGVCLANQQEYAEALRMMKSYLERMPNAPEAATVQKQISQLEKEASAAAPQK